MDYLSTIALAALGGGILCLIAQLLIDLTGMTPARILVFYVCTGVLLFGVGAYDFLFDIFGCGVSLPLIGFGAVIGRGVKEAVNEMGAMGILTGGLSASSAGITFSLILGLFLSFISRGKPKRM